MKALLQSIKWSDRPKVSKEVCFLVGIALAGLLAFFKLRPYFNPAPTVTIAPRHEERSAGLSSFIEHLTLSEDKGASAKSSGRGLSKSGWSPGGAARDRHAPAIIERPLFDGLTVTLKAVLMNSISSHQPDSPVEATVLSLLRDETASDVDSGPAEGAKLIGLMSANLALKRLGFTFTDLVSREGRSYSVSAVALDPDTKMVGVAANYSSGLGSRLLGVTLDQGITLADQIGMAKVLNATTGGSQNTVTQEIQAASLQMNQQTSTSISAEATRELRETPSELSLPAGTPITIRLKAILGAGGGP